MLAQGEFDCTSRHSCRITASFLYVWHHLASAKEAAQCGVSLKVSMRRCQVREMRILELAADLDRVRLSGAQSGFEREHSILQLSERINLCRRGLDEGIDVNKVPALSLHLQGRR